MAMYRGGDSLRARALCFQVVGYAYVSKTRPQCHDTNVLLQEWRVVMNNMPTFVDDIPLLRLHVSRTASLFHDPGYPSKDIAGTCSG
jgi:hypothetical protein